MARLLKIEWLKIRKYSTFWILTALMAVIIIFWNYLISAGVMTFGVKDINILNVNYTFPFVWSNVAYWTKFFSGLIAIIIIILTTNEYQYRTNRQNVIDGWTRSQFYHAKWSVVIFMSIATTLFTAILGATYALVYGSPIGRIGENTIKLLYIFIITLNYFGFALTLSLLLRRSGMAVLVYLLYLYIIETILQKILGSYISWQPGSYLPMQCSADLLDFPLMESLKETKLRAMGPSHNVMIMTSCAWLLVYYLVGRWRLVKSDW